MPKNSMKLSSNNNFIIWYNVVLQIIIIIILLNIKLTPKIIIKHLAAKVLG
jgi:hypothetical protein